MEEPELPKKFRMLLPLPELSELPPPEPELPPPLEEPELPKKSRMLLPPPEPELPPPLSELPPPEPES